ncbi:hypothetical protein [Geodermatophilus siccatus]|uniref:hypothetical protein n=1 Tax=Geodermatophilus siccatus TaxID=1137991 RepID=UPI0011140E30|nr:hypothetical protein [Geodermatophilus siccatus]
MSGLEEAGGDSPSGTSLRQDAHVRGFSGLPVEQAAGGGERKPRKKRATFWASASTIVALSASLLGAAVTVVTAFWGTEAKADSSVRDVVFAVLIAVGVAILANSVVDLIGRLTSRRYDVKTKGLSGIKDPVVRELIASAARDQVAVISELRTNTGVRAVQND